MILVCVVSGREAIVSVISTSFHGLIVLPQERMAYFGSLLGFSSLDGQRVPQVCFPRQLPAEPAQHAVTEDLNIASSGRGCRKGRMRKFVKNREIFECTPIDEI